MLYTSLRFLAAGRKVSSSSPRRVFFANASPLLVPLPEFHSPGHTIATEHRALCATAGEERRKGGGSRRGREERVTFCSVWSCSCCFGFRLHSDLSVDVESWSAYQRPPSQHLLLVAFKTRGRPARRRSFKTGEATRRARRDFLFQPAIQLRTAVALLDRPLVVVVPSDTRT